MPGYGESNRWVGVDYAGKTQPGDRDKGAAAAKSGAAVVVASEQPL